MCNIPNIRPAVPQDPPATLRVLATLRPIESNFDNPTEPKESGRNLVRRNRKSPETVHTAIAYLGPMHVMRKTERERERERER